MSVIAQVPATGDVPGTQNGMLRVERRRLKRAVFLSVATASMGAAALSSFVAAHYLVDHTMVSGGYLGLSEVSAAVVAVLTLRTRPDGQRSLRGALNEWVEAGREILITALLLVVVAFFWRPEPIERFSFSRGTVLVFVPLGIVVLGLARSGMHATLLYLRRRGHNLASVVVVGDSASADSFVRTIAAKRGTGYRVVAQLKGAESASDLATELQQLAEIMSVDEVMIAARGLSASQIREVLGQPALRSVKVRALPELFGLPPSKVRVQEFGDFPLLALGGNPVRGSHWRVKRTIDIVASAVSLVALSPLLALIVTLVRRSSPGPVLFRQERVGMDGRPFNVLKFRTMFQDSSDSLHRTYVTAMLGSKEPNAQSSDLFKVADDPRVTPVGRTLRRFSLDELPQLVNVLRGEMSLVGPRPALRYEVELYDEWERRRLDVMPGMTGLWQVSGRSRLTPADMIRLDVHYAETWSLTSDLVILLRTFGAVLRRDAS